MLNYNTTTQSVTRRTISTVKTYDEEGRLITEETVEEIEYGPVAAAQHPNTPWIITNGANSSHRNHTYQRLDLDPPGPVE